VTFHVVENHVFGLFNGNSSAGKRISKEEGSNGLAPSSTMRLDRVDGGGFSFRCY